MTLKARVIPCLDVKDGRVVKGVNFVNLRDAGDPVESAVAYDKAGADELCFLDITASHEDRGILLDVVRRTAEVCFMPLTVGGGVRTTDDIRNLLLAGADKASINSAAVADRQFVREAAEKFGSQCVVVAIDAKRVSPRGRARRAGRSSPTAAGARPASTRLLIAREVADLGAGEILLTSMDRDGSKQGFDLALTRAIADAVPFRSSPPAASALSTISSTACARATPARCSRRRSSISANSRSGRRRRAWRRRASRSGWTARARCTPSAPAR